jgi:hypothetical protein
VPWPHAAHSAFCQLTGSSYKVIASHNCSVGLHRTITFEGPGSLPTLPHSHPGQIWSSPSSPQGLGTSMSDLQTFVSLPPVLVHTQLIYDPSGVYATSCFLVCMNFHFFDCQAGCAVQSLCFSKHGISLECPKPILSGLQVVPSGAQGSLPATPGLNRELLGHLSEAPSSFLASSSSSSGALGNVPATAGAFQLPLGSFLACPNSPPAHPSIHRAAS